MSRFMETQVTKRLTWVRVENASGESYMIPAEDFIIEDHRQDDGYMELTSEVGYGVRESAPGYLDCTEWEVYPTLAEAEARAAEIDAEYEDDRD